LQPNGGAANDEKNKLKPWQNKSWCIPPKASGEFVAAMEDVLEVYKRRYNPRRPVVCLDETSKQLTEKTRQPIPMRSGRQRRFDYEYRRCGVANVFMMFEPLAAWRRVKVTASRTRVDWARCVRELVDDWYPDATRLVLVMDNLNTHSIGSLYEAFSPNEARRIAKRLEIHYTPKHGSWLNMAEIELSILARQCLNARISNATTLATRAGKWEGDRNAAGATVSWQFTTPKARTKLKQLYPEIKT